MSANYGASTLTVGTGANPVTVDGSKGTITGLTNTKWDQDSAQNRNVAASTGQVADVQSNLQEQLGTLGNNSVQYVVNKDGSVDYNSIIAGNGKATIATIGQDNFGNSIVTGGGTTISNVANGKNASDAVNKGQLDALSTYISNNVTNVKDGASNNVSVTGQVVNQNYTSGKNSNQDSLFLTYDKQGQTTTDQLTIGETVQKMNKEGVKFTHTNSADGKDSSAGAVNSTALGVNAFIKTGADNTIALGNSTFAENTATNSVAIGNNSRVTGASSVAIGNNAIASGDQAISIGAQTKDTDGNTINSIASGTQSISIGTGNQVHGNHSGAFGDPSIIDGTNSYSVGNNNNISTDNTFALGNGITQTMEGSVVLGNNSASRTGAGVGGYIPKDSAMIDQSAINATSSTTGAIAVGDSQNNVYRQITGVAAGTADSDAVNIAQLKAVNNKVLALKTEGNTTSDNSGHSNASTATSNTLSDGTRTNTSTAAGTTYGYADASNLTSTTVNQDGLSIKKSNGTNGASITSTGIDAGSQKVTNVADGLVASGSKDAVNGGQVTNISQSVANVIGGVQVNQDGTISNPSYSIAGGKQTTVSDALNALNQAVQNANTTGKDINVSKVTVSDQAGNNSITDAMGTIVKDGSGNNATMNARGVSVTDSSGNNATYNASNTVYKAADNSGASIGINGLSFNDASGHKVGPSITASGIDAGGKSITGIAAGVNATDAVNKGQLDSAVNNVNNTVNTLSTTAVQYDKNADGSVNKGRVTLGDGTNATTLTNVADGQIVAGSTDAVNGGQLARVQSQVTENTNSINHLNNTVSDLTTGKSGAIQQADKNGDISIGKDTGGAKVNVANSTGATRTVTGVSAGNVTSSSTDAVNGAQLYQSNAAMATVLGGNAQLQSNGTVSTSNIGGTGQNTIDGAVGNLNGRVGNLESAFVQTNQQLSKLRNETNAGIAGAMAVGNLPQPSEAGMSMVSAGVGGYRGEGAVSVGVSAITDSNKYIWKFGASADTRSNVSGAISVGYQWK
ncbi:YadA-like family protein [Acinetobacter nectaris]|nr:YadA-like family protein [Acinetobacter nectaris]